MIKSKKLSNLVLLKLTLTQNVKSHLLTQHVNLLLNTKQNEAEYDKKKLFDPRKFLKPGFEAITEAVEERIDVFGSAKQSLIRLYKLENKGFVQCGQAFFLCFATDLPHLLCKSIKYRYNRSFVFSDMQNKFLLHDYLIFYDEAPRVVGIIVGNFMPLKEERNG